MSRGGPSYVFEEGSRFKMLDAAVLVDKKLISIRTNPEEAYGYYVSC